MWCQQCTTPILLNQPRTTRHSSNQVPRNNALINKLLVHFENKNEDSDWDDNKKISRRIWKVSRHMESIDFVTEFFGIPDIIALC